MSGDQQASAGEETVGVVTRLAANVPAQDPLRGISAEDEVVKIRGI